MTDNKPDQPTPPSRLTPEQIAQVTGDIMQNGLEQHPTPPPGYVPMALGPSHIEELMKRTLQTKEVAEMCTFFRPADAKRDPGAHDLTPLLAFVMQQLRKGPEEASFTCMLAAWALCTFQRLETGKEDTNAL